MSPAERRLGQVRLAEDAGEADQDSSDATYVSDSTSLRVLCLLLDFFFFAAMENCTTFDNYQQNFRWLQARYP